MSNSSEVVLQFAINWLVLQLDTDGRSITSESLYEYASMFDFEIPSGNPQSLGHQHFVTEVIAVYNRLSGLQLQQSQFMFILRAAIEQLTDQDITALNQR